MYDVLIGHNLRPKEKDDPRSEAEFQVRDLLRDAAPEAFAVKSDAEGADNSARAIRGMRELRPGEWEKLDVEKRAEWLVKVHNHIAEQ